MRAARFADAAIWQRRLFMSTAQTFDDSGDAREFSPGEWANARWRRGYRGARRWSLFEVATMILGFMVSWPIGLAVLGYKLWQSRHGGDDLQTLASAKWNEARAAWSRPNAGRYGASGNAAFADWKSAELGRLEAERRKLEEAAREFSAFLDNVRRAKDREEFVRFMNERRTRPQA
jgi:hypothetical protein